MQTTEDPSIAAVIGNSPQMTDLKAAVLKVAPRNTTVLITGETGTGKELFAQAIHQGSLRRFKPFVRVNCAAIPETLLESELFGYAEGTFTGGKKGGYPGKFAQADGGTVFLDEVAELPLALQAKLLRFLQEREIQRLGESQPHRVNVRIVAATNANLPVLVQSGKFRSDLFYRLNVVTLEIPPLRERRADLMPLCQTFMRQLNAEFDYRVYRLSPQVMTLFASYHWPGNVRELANVLEAAYNLCDGEAELQVEHLPLYLRRWLNERQDHESLAAVATMATKRAVNKTGKAEGFHTWQNYLNCLGRYSLPELVDRLEADILRYALSQDKNRSRVATLLGISRPALYKKMHKHQLS